MSMNFLRFQLFNITGAVLWVGGLILLGHFFGNVPIIKEHLNTIVLIGVCAAVVPVARDRHALEIVQQRVLLELQRRGAQGRAVAQVG